MKILLLDPGLRWPRGHHLDLDIRLARALIALGHDVEIAAHREMERDCVQRLADNRLRVRKMFNVSPYRGPNGFNGPLRLAHDEGKATAADLAHASPAELWFWPTFTAVQLLACVIAQPKAKVAGGLWYEPNASFATGAECWTISAKMTVKHLGNIAIGAYDDTVQRTCQSISGTLEIARFPVPYDGVPRNRSRTRPERIGLLGFQRSVRGMSLVPLLVQALLGRGFEVTLQDSGGDSGADIGHPRLRRLGFVDDFAAVLDACDLVLWPSQAESYRSKTSGIICESLASGLPVVMPSHCAPAELVAPTGAGVFFDDFSESCILEAVDRAVTAYPVIAAAAWRASHAWREREGTMRLARTIANC